MGQITRRTALGWMGTSVMAALVDPAKADGLLQRSDPVIDYSVFCHHDPWCRFDISKPFTVGERMYGTDARIIISQSSESQRDDVMLTLPQVDGLPWDVFEQSGWSDVWRSITHYEEVSKKVECHDCEGFGCSLENGVDPCKTCGGDRYLPVIYRTCQINDRKFNFNYIENLKQCGDVEYKLVDPCHNKVIYRDENDDDNRVLFFRFGQTGRGILMPLSEASAQ